LENAFPLPPEGAQGTNPRPLARAVAMMGGMFVPLATLVALLAPVFVPAHPHVPKAVPAALAKGKVTMSYFTVPYNAEQVATLRPGGSWHMGFASLHNDVAIEIGGKTLPPGRWKFNVRRNDEGKFATAELLHLDYYRASGRRGSEEEAAETKARLEKEGLPAMIEVPFPEIPADEDDHGDLSFAVLNHGYQTPKVGQDEPVGGAKCTVFVRFGELHHAFTFREVWEEPAKKESEKKESVEDKADAGKTGKR